MRVYFGRRCRRLAVTVLVLVTAASGSLASATAGTFTAAGSPARHTYGAIAVGMPDLNLPGAKQAGGVDVYFPDGRKQQVTEQKLGLVGARQGDFDRFGTAVAVVELNGDQYPDLVVGAPGLPAKGVQGKVLLLFGSATGIVAKGAQVLSLGDADDEFGAALTVSGRTLYVGAPGLDEDRVTNSGGVYRYSIDSQGVAKQTGLLIEALNALGGVMQVNQRFGEVLAPALDFDGNAEVFVDGLIIGLPNKNIGSAIGAGQMIRYHPALTGSDFTAEIWTQNSPGVPGVAESGDHFGAAVVRNGYAVGVPGEDLGTRVDAGGVQIFQMDPAREAHLRPDAVVTQAARNVPGRAETGDRFGTALATGVFHCRGFTALAVGSPGEDVGTATDAGSVTLVGLEIFDEDSSCAAEMIRQGRGLRGEPETGDAVGTSLGQIDGDPIGTENKFDTLLVGAPGEDVGTAKAHRNTGRASIWNDYRAHYTQSFGYLGGDLRGLRYGTVFGSEAG
jgi:hypothetical protein